ncbi:ABC transporter ATP-binding protein [Myroides sp. LJL119]
MLVLKNISFSYTPGKTIIEDLELVLDKGQHVALIGESGCGKSTLLKLIYGLHDLDKGEIYWNNKQILGPAYNLIPGVDSMHYLAQDFDLMPHTTVWENVGKHLSNFYMDKKAERIAELLKIVDLENFAQEKVKNLSGGQQQRVAIARVLASDPELLLLDEPFAHIDYSKRSSLRRGLFAYLKQQGISCIVATHDSLDALGFADQTVVLKDGEIVDFGPTNEVYQYPISKYVASLFGEVNELYFSDFVENPEKDELMLVYPHQLMRSNVKGKLDVVVKENYFKGDGYLIKCELEPNRFICFDSPLFIEPETPIKLALKKYQ